MAYRGPKPRHREAYPRLNSIEAFQAFKEERFLCRFSSESGNHCGDAILIVEDKQSARIQYQFHREYLAYPAAEEMLECEISPNGVDQSRVFFRCRNCDQRVAILVFDGHWACANCHRLLYRTQLVAPETRRLERKLRLENEIGKGRPHRMRQLTYQALAKELAGLRSDLTLEDAPAPSQGHSLRIDWRWVSLEQVQNIDIYPYILDAICKQLPPDEWARRSQTQTTHSQSMDERES